MNYENIDWDAEAKRVARAFGVEGEFVFVLNPTTSRRVLKSKDAAGATGWIPFTPHQLFGMMLYDDKVRFLCRSTNSGGSAEVTIRQDGSVENCRSPQTGGQFLAKPMFHLDLLTPEVEAALKVSVTAHEKLEWAREYEARHRL